MDFNLHLWHSTTDLRPWSSANFDKYLKDDIITSFSSALYQAQRVIAIAIVLLTFLRCLSIMY